MTMQSIMEEQQDTKMALYNRGFGKLRDYQGGTVAVIWGGRNLDMRKAGLFWLDIGGKRVLLNKNDLQYLLRNV